MFSLKNFCETGDYIGIKTHHFVQKPSTWWGIVQRNKIIYVFQHRKSLHSEICNINWYVLSFFSRSISKYEDVMNNEQLTNNRSETGILFQSWTRLSMLPFRLSWISSEKRRPWVEESLCQLRLAALLLITLPERNRSRIGGAVKTNYRWRGGGQSSSSVGNS